MEQLGENICTRLQKCKTDQILNNNQIKDWFSKFDAEGSINFSGFWGAVYSVPKN